MSQKSYDGQPSLYLVPTPIGNMEDMTFRAVKVLGSVDVIFSEDTRVTNQLLHYYHIEKHVIALHEHNEEKVIHKVLEYLEKGSSVALVTDRGTPIISDPGYKCSRAVIDAGFHVISLPGATALIPALTMSGLNPSPFLFYGFLNSKTSKQKKELECLKDYPFTMIFYEAPHRILDTLDSMKTVFGNRKISISREISKKFEEVYRGTIDEVSDTLQVKGEFVLVVAGKEMELCCQSPLTIEEELYQLLREGKTKKEAVKEVSHRHKDLSKNEVYQVSLKLKCSFDE